MGITDKVELRHTNLEMDVEECIKSIDQFKIRVRSLNNLADKQKDNPLDPNLKGLLQSALSLDYFKKGVTSTDTLVNLATGKIIEDEIFKDILQEFNLKAEQYNEDIELFEKFEEKKKKQKEIRVTSFENVKRTIDEIKDIFKKILEDAKRKKKAEYNSKY